MSNQTVVLTRTNQNYQFTVPLSIERKVRLKKGMRFIVKMLSQGILFQPIAMANEQKIEYADPLDARELESVKQSLKEFDQEKYATISNQQELEEHFNNL